MAAFVDENGEIAIDAVEHGDVAVGIVGVATVRVREHDHVANILSGMDGQPAEEIYHVVNGIWAVLVAAENPGSAQSS